MHRQEMRRRTRRRLAGWVALATFLVPLLATTFGCSGRSSTLSLRSNLPWVAGIEFEGNEVFGSGKLKSLMTLKAPGISRPFSRSYYFPDLLEKDLEDITAFYKDKGYLDFEVVGITETYDEGRDNVRLLIQVQEGAVTVVQSITFEGAEAHMRKKLLDTIRLEEGKPFSPFVSQGDRDRLRALYFNDGYLFANVDVRLSQGEQTMDATYVVDEGPTARLRHVDAPTDLATGERYITREAPVQAGEVVTRTDIVEWQRRLGELRLFSLARPYTVTVDSSGTVDLKVDVRERKPGWYGFGFGFSSDARVRFTAEFGHRNVFGSTRRIRSFAAVGWDVDSLVTRGTDRSTTLRQFRVTWVEPWVFGTRTEGIVEWFGDFRQGPRFRFEANGLSFSLRREFTSTTDLLLRLTPQWVSTNDTIFTSGEFAQIGLSLEGERFTKNSILDPLWGSYQRASATYSQAEFAFAKFVLITSHDYPLDARREHVLALRAEGGLIEPVNQPDDPDLVIYDIVPAPDRFYLGGSTNLRGYRRQEVGPLGPDDITLGGTLYVLGSVEYRFPLVWKFRGGLFMDLGNVWAVPEDAKLGSFFGTFGGGGYSEFDVLYAAGGGIRFMTPVGPLRLDYARKLGAAADAFSQPYEVHLALGHSF